MELDMKKDIKSSDKISEGTLHEILLDIKYRLDHLEDIEADNRTLIVKLIKQSNSVVKFLASIDMEPVGLGFEDIQFPSKQESKPFKSDRFRSLKDLINEFMEKTKEMKEFEEELKKNKDKLTPGQAGEA